MFYPAWFMCFWWLGSGYILEPPRFQAAVAGGRLDSGAAREISGLIHGRRNPNLLWAHNDSGDIPRLFAFDRQGRLCAELHVRDATAFDWEDGAAVTRGGQSLLLVGDIGDNRRSRDHVVILGLVEPAVDQGGKHPVIHQRAAHQWRARYPDGPRDAETLLADPDDGGLYIIEKSAGPTSGVYKLDPSREAEIQIMIRVATLHFGREPMVGSFSLTGGDIRGDGRVVLLRTYARIFWWARGEGESIASALAKDPLRTPNPLEIQGESIAFLPGSSGYVTASEGLHPPLWFFEQVR